MICHGETNKGSFLTQLAGDYFTAGFCVYVNDAFEKPLQGENNDDLFACQKFNQYRFEKKHRKIFRWPPVYADDSYISEDENERYMRDVTYKKTQFHSAKRYKTDYG